MSQDGQDDYRQDARLSRPGLAKRMDHSNSATSAIKMWCITQCQGGNRKAAKECTNFGCFFFPYGLAEAERPKGTVPTPETYDSLKREMSEEHKAKLTEMLVRRKESVGEPAEDDDGDAGRCERSRPSLTASLSVCFLSLSVLQRCGPLCPDG